MKARFTHRVLTVLLTTAVATPVFGVAAAGAASPGKTSGTTPTTATVPALTAAQIEERCANAATDTRTTAQVNAFMRNDTRSMQNVAANHTGAALYYNNGYFGQGIDIALIDSGVAPVPGLDKDNVLNGPDLSWESQAVHAAEPNVDIWQRDTFGHGTHLAGIMTGRDVNAINKNTWDDDPTRFMGIAPLARTINMKVADAGGATDVTQVIAAIDWVVEHAHDPKLNIRVINLSYGLNSYTSANQDALSYAVQQAWNAGIVVVAAAGNEGKAGTLDDKGISQDLGLTSPAYNRDVIAVGSYGTKGASDFSTGSSSENMRLPDFAAWGESLPSLHVKGSRADDMIIDACQTALAKGEAWTTPIIGADGRFVKGSGTSQAAAVASAAVALMLSKSPSLTPEQVKKTLSLSAEPIGGAGRRQVGEGRMRLDNAFYKVVKDSNPTKDAVEWTNLSETRGDSVLESPVKESCANFGSAKICTPSRLNGNADWLGHPINPATLMAAEAVSAKKSPYCLDVNEYVSQKSYTNGKCNSPHTAFSPKAWTVDVDANGFVYEKWNGGPGLHYTGQKFLFSPDQTKTPPAVTWPVKWPAPAWLGIAFSDMYWGDIAWVTDLGTNRWRVSRLKESDFSVSRLRGHDFTVSRLRANDWSVSRLRGSRFTVSRLKDFGWRDFAWS